MRYFTDTFALAPGPQAVLDSLRQSLPEFAHQARHSIGCLFSQRTLLDRGAPCRALTVVPAQISSKQPERLFHEWAMAQVFTPLYHGALPDFVCFLDIAEWPAHDRVAQEQLVYHELLHIQPKLDEYGAPRFEKSGRQVLHLVRHDAELFHAELERYGRLVPGFDEVALAIASGAREKRLRLA